MIVEIYSKPQCSLCDKAKEVLTRVQNRVPFELREVDIEQDRRLFEEFRYDIPVVFVNGRKAFKHHLDERVVEERLRREEGG